MSLTPICNPSPWRVHVLRIYRVSSCDMLHERYIVRCSCVFLIILGKGDVTLTMDDENRSYVDYLKEQHGGRAELRNFCELCAEEKHGQFDEVPDPYYGGQDGFELVLDLLEDGCANLLNQLRGV